MILFWFVYDDDNDRQIWYDMIILIIDIIISKSLSMYEF